MNHGSVPRSSVSTSQLAALEDAMQHRTDTMPSSSVYCECACAIKYVWYIHDCAQEREKVHHDHVMDMSVRYVYVQSTGKGPRVTGAPDLNKTKWANDAAAIPSKAAPHPTEKQTKKKKRGGEEPPTRRPPWVERESMLVLGRRKREQAARKNV